MAGFGGEGTANVKPSSTVHCHTLNESFNFLL